MTRLGIAPLALVFGVFVAPSLRAQASPSKMCKDGTTITSASGRACAPHGGVKGHGTAARARHRHRQMEGGEVSMGKKDERVQCADGQVLFGGVGRCASHGGVSIGDPRSVDRDVPREGQRDRALSDAARRKADRIARGEEDDRGDLDEQGDWKERRGRSTENSSTGEISATARCKDGTSYYAKKRRGACSDHGGVAAWITP